MADAKNTPEKEVKKQEEAPAAEGKTEEKKEVTVGEVVQQKAKEVPKPATVGLDKFLDLKEENKEQKKLIKDLEARLEDGETKEEILEDIDGLADEYNVDKRFLNKLVKAVKTSTEREVEARVSSKFKSIEDRENADKIDKAFTKHFGKAMETMPEYSEIVNPDVIRTLSLDPSNSNKTFPQLIEETYGKVLSGKRTIEQTRPRGGKEPDAIDFNKARNNPAYLKEVLSDPDLKKEYNKGLIERLGM